MAERGPTVEEWLARVYGYDVDPNRTRGGVAIDRLPVSEPVRSPPPRECPEANRSGPED